MFENITYESLLKRILERMPGDLDKREGSILYNAIAPAAVELQNMYIQLDWVLDQVFADTAGREYLIRRCKERGIIPYPATNAILKGEFNQDIEIGSRFSLDQLNYRAVERIAPFLYKMECETKGEAGNQAMGPMIPIDYIKGLTKAELVEVLIPGEEEEDTEALRKRYYESLNSQAFGGNIADYKIKVNAIPGVGGCKIEPVWAGGGTVKVKIINSEFGLPSKELIQTVQEAIDPPEYSGKGYGLAPIGHVVTVEGAGGAPIEVSMDITFQGNTVWEDIKETAETAIDEYLKSLCKTWAETVELVVRASRIEMALLNIPGVVDVENIRINQKSGNLIVSENQIPVRGAVYG